MAAGRSGEYGGAVREAPRAQARNDRRRGTPKRILPLTAFGGWRADVPKELPAHLEHARTRVTVGKDAPSHVRPVYVHLPRRIGASDPGAVPCDEPFVSSSGQAAGSEES